jgi:hypothetical protein
MRASIVAGIAALVMTVAMGCQHAPRESSAAIEPDSLSGIVSITGSAFEQRLILRSGNSATLLSAVASDSAALSRLGGVEVLVIGRRTPGVFHVERFTAVSVAGSPVADGFVRYDGGRLALETTRGRVPLGNPPTALRGLIGARVWIGGPLDSGPNSYGVIVPVQ